MFRQDSKAYFWVRCVGDGARGKSQQLAITTREKVVLREALARNRRTRPMPCAPVLTLRGRHPTTSLAQRLIWHPLSTLQLQDDESRAGVEKKESRPARRDPGAPRSMKREGQGEDISSDTSSSRDL